jgi:hypothetical protein
MSTTISRDIIEAYLNCKYKGYLRLAEERGIPSEYETVLAAEGQRARAEVFVRLVDRLGSANVVRDSKVTPTVLKRGIPLLVDADLEDDGLPHRRLRSSVRTAFEAAC